MFNLHSGTSSQQSQMPDPHLSDSLEIITGCGCVNIIVFDMFTAKRGKQTERHDVITAQQTLYSDKLYGFHPF